jgi:hypothetical protein
MCSLLFSVMAKDQNVPDFQGQPTVGSFACSDYCLWQEHSGLKGRIGRKIQVRGREDEK